MLNRLVSGFAQFVRRAFPDYSYPSCEATNSGSHQHELRRFNNGYLSSGTAGGSPHR